MIVLLVESYFSNLSDIITEQIVSFWGIVLFIAISATFAISQFLMLQIVKTRKIEEHSHPMRITEHAITLVQYILTSIIVFIILQILFSSLYYKDLLIASYSISYGSAIYLTGSSHEEATFLV